MYLEFQNCLEENTSFLETHIVRYLIMFEIFLNFQENLPPRKILKKGISSRQLLIVTLTRKRAPA